VCRKETFKRATLTAAPDATRTLGHPGVIGANVGAKRQAHAKVEQHKMSERAASRARSASMSTTLPREESRKRTRYPATGRQVEPGRGSDDLDDRGARDSPANRVAYRRVVLGPLDYLAQLLGGYALAAKTNHDTHGKRTWELGAC